jgi:hypothetical protein
MIVKIRVNLVLLLQVFNFYLNQSNDRKKWKCEFYRNKINTLPHRAGAKFEKCWVEVEINPNDKIYLWYARDLARLKYVEDCLPEIGLKILGSNLLCFSLFLLKVFIDNVTWVCKRE